MQTEEQLQAALERYQILDTPPEATFDRVVDIVMAVFNTNIAMITLVDRERSWYKSERGFGVSELPRADNMCDAVIRQDGVLVIDDSLEAPPELAMPLLKAGPRFYAGAPLRTHDGIIIGTLCTLDPEPRQVSERERQILEHLADIVIDELELRLNARKMAGDELELRRLNRELEVAGQNKNEFLASMSHELRTPLNGILGASELLGQGLFGELAPRQQEYVGDIHQSGLHLLRLIDDLLDLSKIAAGQIELRPERLDVAQLLENSAAIVRGSAISGDINLILVAPEHSLEVEADERRLTQVACNLLSNALKFTPEGGRVVFKAWSEGSSAVFVVEDEGPGIAPEHHERIFEQFFRVPNDREGTGLGLPLARQLLVAQGGRIWLESEVGRGSRFYFSLPLAGLS